MPDPSNLPKGCAFCPRCEYAMEICKTQKPPRTYRNDTHYVECHLYNKDNIHEILQKEVGNVFVHVLEDAGVYKCTPEGREAFMRFIETL